MFGAELWKLLSVTLVLGIDRRASQSFGPYTQYVKVSISQHFFCVFFVFVLYLCLWVWLISVTYQAGYDCFGKSLQLRSSSHHSTTTTTLSGHWSCHNERDQNGGGKWTHITVLSNWLLLWILIMLLSLRFGQIYQICTINNISICNIF